MKLEYDGIKRADVDIFARSLSERPSFFSISPKLGQLPRTASRVCGGERDPYCVDISNVLGKADSAAPVALENADDKLEIA